MNLLKYESYIRDVKQSTFENVDSLPDKTIFSINWKHYVAGNQILSRLRNFKVVRKQKKEKRKET